MSGVSRAGEGRAAYLRHRRQSAPEEKFTLPMTTSQAMSWGITEFLPSVVS